MILNRLLRQIGINWKYAVGEILLIFIGISLSLMFDQWRTAASNRIKENELLSLLVQSVKNDTADLEFKIDQSTKTLNSVNYLLLKLQDNSQFSDSISMAFSLMTYNPQFEPDMLGYDNIQTAGFSIISDNSLRQDIIQYYSRVKSNTGWGDGVRSHIEQYISPRIITDFEDYEFQQKGIPFDFKKLKSDKIFINALKKLKRLNIVSIERLMEQKKHGERFLIRLTATDRN